MPTNLVLSVFVAVEGAHAFSAFMPSYFTVKKFADQEEDVESLRSGYTPAIAFNILLGSTVSFLTKDIKPLIMAIVVILFMVYLYEGAIAPKQLESKEEEYADRKV